MFRTFAVATLTLLATLTSAAPAKADFFDLDDVGRLLRNQGFRPRFNNGGFYTIRQGNFDVRVFPSRDRSRLIFQSQLVGFGRQDFFAPQFNQLFRQNGFQFGGQFQLQNDNLFFEQQFGFRDFNRNNFGFQLNNFARNLDRNERFWNPRFWNGR